MELTEEQKAELEKPFVIPDGEPDALTVNDEPQADAQAPVADPVVTEPKSDDESKVPYSRFKKFHDAATQAQEEAAYWRGKAEALENQPAPTTTTTDTELPESWVELFGDSPASVKAWKLQSQTNAQMLEQARAEALAAVRSERGQEEQVLKQNEQIIDENFGDLADQLGRDLTEKEVSAILDIVDEYTPKDANGYYAGEPISFDKAWDIYEMKNQVIKAPKAQARDHVASLSGTPSQGDTSITDTDKNFNPLDWNAWKKRI